MNKQVLIDELKGRFQPLGEVIIGSIADKSGNIISDLDSIRLKLSEPSNVEVHLCNFMRLYPDVIIDVNNQESLQYSFNLPSDQVINSARVKYYGLDEEINDIQQYVVIIHQVFLVTFAFDSASYLINQYYATHERNADLLRNAYRQLCQYNLYSDNCLTLLNAIKTEASRKNIELN